MLAGCTRTRSDVLRRGHLTSAANGATDLRGAWIVPRGMVSRPVSSNRSTTYVRVLAAGDMAKCSVPPSSDRHTLRGWEAQLVRPPRSRTFWEGGAVATILQPWNHPTSSSPLTSRFRDCRSLPSGRKNRPCATKTHVLGSSSSLTEPVCAERRSDEECGSPLLGTAGHLGSVPS